MPGQSLSKNYSGKLSFSVGFWPISSVFRQVRQSYHKILKIRQFRQFLGLKIATGDVSPALISHRHREAQNRGFGEKSPEMLTLQAQNEHKARHKKFSTTAERPEHIARTCQRSMEHATKNGRSPRHIGIRSIKIY